jgi:hypothetical protein
MEDARHDQSGVAVQQAELLGDEEQRDQDHRQ